MLKKVVLHVGPPKTGTTTIQRALHTIRAELLRFGIYYPDRTEGHPELAWQIIADLGRPVGYWCGVELSWESVLADAANANAHTLFISSEDFCHDEFDAVAFSRLRKLIGPLPVTVVFAVRDPAETVLSAWRQSVKWGVGSGEALMDINEAVAHLARRAAIRVSPYVEQIKSGLGDATIRLFTIPSPDRSFGILAHFAEAAGLPDPICTKLGNAADLKLNPSLSYKEILILLQINRLEFELDPASHTFPSNCDAFRLAVRCDIIEAIRHLRSSIGSQTETISPATAGVFRQLRGDLIEWLRGQEILGSLQDLDPHAFDGMSIQPCLQSDGDHVNDATAAALHSMGQKLRMSLVQLEGARDYLGEVVQAREWWRRQAELWERQATGGTQQISDSMQRL